MDANNAPKAAIGKTWAVTGWDGGNTATKLAEAFPDLPLEVVTFRNETTIKVPAASATDVLAFLRDDPELAYDMLSDVTAVHWPARPAPFEVV